VVIMAKPYSEFKICIRTPSGLTTIGSVSTRYT
jgi:hypothetical protein